MELTLRNTSSDWASISKVVFSAYGMKLYYDSDVFMKARMDILNRNTAETGFELQHISGELRSSSLKDLKAGKKLSEFTAFRSLVSYPLNFTWGGAFDHGYQSSMDSVLYTTSKAPVTLGDLLKFVLILSFSILLSRILTLYLRRSLKDKVSKDVGETVLKILYYGSLIIVFISVLPLIGLDPSALLLAGGVTGIILGFASQNIVGNLVSGFFLMVERPIKIGDQVQINDISGYVTDIRIISTLIRTYDGLLVRIPNQQVFTTNITNIVGHPVRRFE